MQALIRPDCTDFSEAKEINQVFPIKLTGQAGFLLVLILQTLRTIVIALDDRERGYNFKNKLYTILALRTRCLYRT
ncbi:hypothetical protein V2L05_09840 [Pseudomonas alliivorans]|uniref:hypothetical protein n=1 Tax=Pseudomonas alliivorans TaxID=2810613 RepID=UPI00161CC48C|nr:hypothetical protein [Pseudomonas alliivorans]MBP0950377.1 hypothetical protein [Pseudomonas alliivorans]MEE4344101.1 hypothetical protein [Pseudomonas alliivorans]MEE4372136.1 hypothetical protein [Pseudomonas alliivorans]MEE4622339.1 hypothetical protein [Pseudomonas alliivorans]MEE4669519.1 hypothetical protein [Pseudomonas alliivorans]